ncbi:MAG: hypothetical protein V1774_11960 [Candidatus Eisenbacteria bacterium]
MPHVQIVGRCRVRDLHAPLAEFLAAAPPEVLKIQGAYLDREGRHLILEAIVVEQYLRQTFFLLIREEEGALIVRCHPFSAPQKTPGVKRLIARIALRCLEQYPAARIGNTNLREYLPPADPPPTPRPADSPPAQG